MLLVKGEVTEFYTIGAFARSLNRRPVTLRKWERDGFLPTPMYHDPRVRGKGKQRLYTRAQIETAVRIAAEEGLLSDTRKHITTTAFRDRCFAAWKGLELEGIK
jgi:hypothetical protein